LKLGNPCTIRYGDATKTFATVKGRTYAMEKTLDL
jgi:hypothetical protein